MSIQEFYEDLILLSNDGSLDPEYGDFIPSWGEKYPFKGAIAISSSNDFKLADKLGNEASITITTDEWNEDFIFGAKIKRVKDDTVLEIINLADDYVAPTKSEATNNVRMFICKRVTL